VAQPDVEIPSAAYGVALPLASVGGFVDSVGFLTSAPASTAACGSVTSPAGALLALRWDLWSLALPLAGLTVLIGADLRHRA